jgi:hypothetical protein
LIPERTQPVRSKRLSLPIMSRKSNMRDAREAFAEDTLGDKGDGVDIAKDDTVSKGSDNVRKNRTML